MCFDILTGINKWKAEGERRMSGRYVVGVNDDYIVVAGNNEAMAYQFDGKLAWRLPYPARQTLAGKGIWRGDSFLLPLSNQQVIHIDARKGAIVDTVTVDSPLGNLFAYREQLLSVSPTAVSVYYTRESLQREVQARVAKDPDDIWAQNQQSQLLAGEGKFTEAIELLEKSYTRNPELAETRFYLVATLLKALEVDFDKYQPVAQKYDSVFELSFSTLPVPAEPSTRERSKQNAPRCIHSNHGIDASSA